VTDKQSWIRALAQVSAVTGLLSVINVVVKTTKDSFNCKESELLAYVFNLVRTNRLSVLFFYLIT